MKTPIEITECASTMTPSTISDRAPNGPERTWTEQQVSASAAEFLNDGRLAYVERLVGERGRADVRVEEVFGVPRLASHGVGPPQARELRVSSPSKSR